MVLAISYAALLLGAAFLTLDVTDRLRLPFTQARTCRVVGSLLSFVPGFLPATALIGNWWDWSGVTFPLIAAGHAVLSLAFVAGVLGDDRRWAERLRRVAYAAWLVLAAVPSFVLLPLTAPFVGLAGMALTQPATGSRRR